MVYTQRYSYDKLGNIQQLRHTTANSADFFTSAFDYGRGAINYLQQVDLAGAQVMYQYDAAGNVARRLLRPVLTLVFARHLRPS